MRMVPDVRPADAVKTQVSKPARHHAGAQAVLLELRASVLPLVTATIEVAEQVRVRLMGIHKKIAGDASKVSPMFSGKDSDGTPRKDHGHAFILPLGNARGRIDRVLIYTRSAAGFGSDEVQAMLRLTELYGRSPDDPIRVLATWRGKAEDGKVRKPARSVASVTPFCPGRHWRKGRGSYEEFLATEVKRECRNHGLAEPVRVELMSESKGLFEWVEFRRNRKDEEPRPGYGFRLEFAEGVPTPFSLGYGCHFGLGQFAAAE
jgi:CRISPR-associated protein Csb2